METLVIGAGQAGLAMSYWLGRAGVEHRLLDRRPAAGGAWPDRWDGFCLNTPNFSLRLPGMPYAGPEPGAFMARDDVVSYLRRYAEEIAAPVETGTEVLRISRSHGDYALETNQGPMTAPALVMAVGGYHTPHRPALAADVPDHITQLHSSGYRNPEQLPDGDVLVVGTGQSGGQIAEELHAAGKGVHLAVSMCLEAPRRYRGHDIVHWILELGRHGPDVGIDAFTLGRLPGPAARFACNAVLSGAGGGHDVHLKDLARRGMHLCGHLERIEDGQAVFTDDLPERLDAVESGFRKNIAPVIDAYIEAAAVEAPAAEPPRHDPWLPPAGDRIDFAAQNLTAIVWATGYRLDFGFLDLPVLDAWNYPRHVGGALTGQPGLYVLGLPWLTSQTSSLMAGVGRDAEYVAGHLKAHLSGRSAVH